jgi:hypothetical protein
MNETLVSKAKEISSAHQVCASHVRDFAHVNTRFRLAGFKARVDKDELSPIEYVFHGTDPENLDSIMRTGMDPKLRRCGGDFFTTDPRIALTYSRWPEFGILGQRMKMPHGKVLVFLVITLEPGLLSRSPFPAPNARWWKNDMVIMDKVEYELPICEVTIGREEEDHLRGHVLGGSYYLGS